MQLVNRFILLKANKPLVETSLKAASKGREAFWLVLACRFKTWQEGNYRVPWWPLGWSLSLWATPSDASLTVAVYESAFWLLHLEASWILVLCWQGQKLAENGNPFSIQFFCHLSKDEPSKNFDAQRELCISHCYTQ